MPDFDGTDGDDIIRGSQEDDRIRGLGGNDTLNGLGGADILDGGDGSDIVSYFDSAAGVRVNLATGTGSGGTATGDTLVSIERVHGSAHADTLIG
ncbi:hypothetical protein [Inquilinus sp. Marseille-Q2685]|uniref:hypothetical protein n=1 Tax=Inquilinus sp. Marseille-Q2685 TaxID=2866581 RepID=UPI001CE46FEE|nr:hypothetical protein [Inquilinus sp. Marseille-Q2685]